MFWCLAMDLDLEKANECYRDEDSKLFLMVTASDESSGTGPVTCVAEDKTLSSGEEDD
jgi:hypothetical protein